MQEGNEFAAIEDLKLNIIYPEKKEVTVGELPRSIRLFVFADDFSWGINTQATLKQLRAQLRGMDADVYF